MCKLQVEFIGCSPELVSVLASVFSDHSLHFSHKIRVYGPEADLNTGLQRDAYNILIAADLPPASVAGLFSDIWFLPLNERQASYRLGLLLHRIELENQVAQDRAFILNITDSSPNLIWIKDREGHHTFVNDSFCKAVGKPKELVTGQTHAFIWDVEEDDPACLESERIVMETGRHYVSQEEIFAGGEKRLLTVHKAPLRDARGQITGTVGIAIDCTRERQYRDHLVQSGAALDAMFTSLDCGLVYHDADFSITNLNQAALVILGCPTLKDLQAVNYCSLMDIIAPDDRERVRQMLTGLTSSSQAAGFECSIITPANKTKYVFAKSRLVENNGRLEYQTYLLDCTEQKKREERKSQERKEEQTELVRALGADYQIVLWRDLKAGVDKIFHINHASKGRLERIFSERLCLCDSLECYINECVHPDDQELFRQACSPDFLNRELLDRSTFYHNYRIIVEGELRYCQMKVARLGQEDLSGFVMGLLNVDAQTRREMEDKQRLETALQLAKKASQAKSTFLSNMSHDIRTPLNAIVGYASLAMKYAHGDAYLSPYLNKILNSGKHLVSLINDILDMSHIESGKMQLTEAPCKMTDIIDELANMVGQSAREKNQTLEIDAEGLSYLPVLCDKLHLKQILLNLISNAIKYTPAEGRIDISIRETPAADFLAYEFRVKDNGIGMSEEFRQRIFEPFERERTSTVAGIQGTGLGMAIAKNIAQLMGGDIEVRSEAGVGSEFILNVAFRIAAEEEAEETPASEKNHCGGRLLLAEDNEMNQEIALEFLTDAGYQVDIANNGREALEKLQLNRDYDLILMDVQMPVMDGYAAVKAIRALDDNALASIPVLALTANSFEEDKQEALRNGMNGHVAKPIDFKLLFKTLEALLGRHDQQPEKAQ